MNRWAVAGLGAVVAFGSAVGARAALGARPPGGERRWTRVNHAGSPVSMLEGPALAAGLLLGGATAALAAGRPRAAAATALAAGSAFAFGLVDDLTEDSSNARKGLRGHLGALASGELTTGGLKVLGIAAGGLAAAAVLPASGTGPAARGLDRVVSGALVASAANLANLLDLRPGRALKVAALHVPALAGAGVESAALAGALLGAGAGVGAKDLAGQDMLGDSGANALGAVLGTGIVLAVPRTGRWVALALILAATLASEKVSFTQVIERTPVLRALDAWGRPGRSTLR